MQEMNDYIYVRVEQYDWYSSEFQDIIYLTRMEISVECRAERKKLQRKNDSSMQRNVDESYRCINSENRRRKKWNVILDIQYSSTGTGPQSTSLIK